MIISFPFSVHYSLYPRSEMKKKYHRLASSCGIIISSRAPATRLMFHLGLDDMKMSKIFHDPQTCSSPSSLYPLVSDSRHWKFGRPGQGCGSLIYDPAQSSKCVELEFLMDIATLFGRVAGMTESRMQGPCSGAYVMPFGFADCSETHQFAADRKIECYRWVGIRAWRQV